MATNLENKSATLEHVAQWLEHNSLGNVELLELVESRENAGASDAPDYVDAGAAVERLHPFPRHHLTHAHPRGGVLHLKWPNLLGSTRAAGDSPKKGSVRVSENPPLYSI
jgi:hypothetical protein